MIFKRLFIEKNDKRNFIAPVQSEPIEDIEIIPENEVPKGSPPVDLSAEFAELNQESGNVMAEGNLLPAIYRYDRLTGQCADYIGSKSLNHF